MMRSLWTAATGMKAQQTSLDTISNNLANINTTGYRRETTEFQSLLYQTIQEKTNDTNGVTKPIGAQVGLGVKVSAISTSYVDNGELIDSDGVYMAMDFLWLRCQMALQHIQETDILLWQ